MSINRKSNKTFIGGLAVAFLLPLSFYLIAKAVSKKPEMPGHYAIAQVDIGTANGHRVLDTVYHQAGDIQLTNQLGKAVSLNNDLKGKVIVVDFFFVDCPAICPRMTHNMAMLQTAFNKDPKRETSLTDDVQLLSVTVNPEHDSFPVLRAYADRYNANHDRWWFLTGNKKNIYDYARQQLYLDVPSGNGDSTDFIHTEKWVLLDKNRYIRGYYNGLDTADIKRCADDIVLLALENDHPKKKK